ncbi:ATP-binding protein [Massilia sp. W12]|uniref:ATP-binding protein n=1 Tax=Massilia sp. W12 TaxID=3126507 RepID=UPI0030CB47DA
MDLLVSAAELEQMQMRAAQLQGAPCALALAALVWYQVETDGASARANLQKLHALLPSLKPGWEQEYVRMRMMLAQARIALLQAELPLAQQIAAQVWHIAQTQAALLAQDGGAAGLLLTCLQAVQARLDRLEGGKLRNPHLPAADETPPWQFHDHPARDLLFAGADAMHILAITANDAGNADLRDAHWNAMRHLALAAGDLLRARLPLLLSALRQRGAARELVLQEFGPFAPEEWAESSPALQACLLEYWGGVLFRQDDYAQAIKCFQQAFELAQCHCMNSRAIISGLSTGIAYATLNDHDTALKWKQRALDLANRCGWPVSIGTALVSCGETLRLLRQFGPARETMQQALHVLDGLQNSFNYAMALRNRGFLALDEQDPGLANQYFTALIERTRILHTPELEVDGLRGLALAWLHQGEAARALEVAQQALQLARTHENRSDQMECLQTLAAIWRQLPPQALPPPWRDDAQGAARLCLDLLEQAYQLAGQITQHQVSDSLLEALADAHAALHNFAAAYHWAQQAAAAREKTVSRAATARAIAMQVAYSTEEEQDRRRRHQQLALAEARRAGLLQQTTHTLTELGAIGQEITTHLQADAIFAILHNHVRELLAADAFCVYFLRAREHGPLMLELAYGIENGKALPPVAMALDDPHSYAIRCLREEREIQLELPASAPHLAQQLNASSTLPCLSCLYIPMQAGQRSIGVMSVQSCQEQAYQEQHLLIFRTLCAYAAIAFDNAHAYAQLQQTRQQLVAQEKLAALGGLVAGVAHELNTPLGNSMLMASALHLKTEQTIAGLENQSLRHANLAEYLEDAAQAAQLISKSLSTAATLVGSFKQVAVDRTSAKRRCFDLQQTCAELCATMMNQVRQRGHQLQLDIPANMLMDSYPGPLGQVLGHLISNALQHAYAPEQKGCMRLSARASSTRREWLELRFSDDGAGIAAAELRQVFDPFYTTRIGQGSIGLGLSICHNIVSSILGGVIRVESETGQGACFILDLPQICDNA